MKKMLKLILLALFVFIDINAFGQGTIVKGGLSFASVSNKLEGGTHTHSVELKRGFHFGITHEEAISDNFLLEAGPMLQMKGSHFSNSYYDEINTIYLDLPILLKFYFEIDEKVFIYNAAGGYLGIGLIGNEELSDEWSENNDLKRLDIGFSLGAGLDFNGLQIGFGFDRSLLNISSNLPNSNRYNTKNNVIRFSFGYRFGKREKRQE